MALLQNLRIQLQSWRATPSQTSPLNPLCTCVDGASHAFVILRSLDGQCKCVDLSPKWRRLLRMSICGNCNDVKKAYHIGRKTPAEQCPRAHWFPGKSASVLRAVWAGVRMTKSKSTLSSRTGIGMPVQKRCIASLLRNTLRTFANRPLEIPSPARPTTLYKDVELRASAIADSLRTAAAYSRVSLPCQTQAVDETLNRSSPSSCGKITSQQAVESRAALSEPISCVTVGLLLPPLSLSLLSALLAVWSCGASSIILPYPDVTHFAVGDDSERASTADTAIVFNKRGMALVAYSADSLAEGNIGSNVYDSTCNSTSVQPPSLSEGNTREHRTADFFVHQWEYHLTESGCRLLLASPEVATVLTGLSAKLSIPMCIMRLPDEKRDYRQLGKAHSAFGEDPERSHVSMYVRDVPHNTRKTSTNITKWKALKEEEIKETQKRCKSLRAYDEAHRAAMLFPENSGFHSPKVVVYTHGALEGQVLRNKQLLGLNPADAVVLFAPDYAAKYSPAYSTVNDRKVNQAGARLWSLSRMTCAPKGLLTVALPAVAAGASLSVITSCVTDCTSDVRSPRVHLQRLASRLPDQLTNYCAEASCENVRVSSGRTCRHLRDGHTLTSAPACLEGVQLWEALASMQVKISGGTTGVRRDKVTQPEAQVDDHVEKKDSCGVSVLAMDLKTAAAMLAALPPEEEGIPHAAPENTFDDGRGADRSGDGASLERDQNRTSSSTSCSQRSFPGKQFLSRECARRHLGAARALRLVCICTDEEDLGEELNCRSWGTPRSSTGFTHINTVVHGWQELVSPHVKLLHLCSLTQVGLFFLDDGRRIKKLAKSGGTIAKGYGGFVERPELSLGDPPLRTSTGTSGFGSCENGFTTLGGVAPYDVKADVDSETGLLKITSPYGAAGYYKRPRSTAETFGTHGEFHSSFRGRVVADRDDSASAACSSPAVDHQIILQGSLQPASVHQVPLLYRLVRRLRKGPKMERHIEGWVKKRPIAGRDWCNLHASKRHRKQMFR